MRTKVIQWMAAVAHRVLDRPEPVGYWCGSYADANRLIRSDPSWRIHAALEDRNPRIGHVYLERVVRPTKWRDRVLGLLPPNPAGGGVDQGKAGA